LAQLYIPPRFLPLFIGLSVQTEDLLLNDDAAAIEVETNALKEID